MGRKGLAFIFLALVSIAWRASAALPQIDLQLVTGSVANPVYITNAGDGSGRLFIVEQGGRIRIFNGTNLLATPFLDISSQVLSSGEQGLLSVAFHPGYATNGQFFVFFTTPDGNNKVARFTASPPSSNTVNTNTMVTILPIVHTPANFHNGGQLQFGPDGYLYIGNGDGGSDCDNLNQAQSLNILLGKILRVNVSNFSTNYTIPPGNPFVGVPGALPEIWAYGLRNPWRFSFDRVTGDLWIGDAGENQQEEIDFQAAGSSGGQNYGWNLYEGFATNTCGMLVSNVPSVLPVITYDHSLGRCVVIGGYRYRGPAIAPLVGMYFYADDCGGQIYGATNFGSAWVSMLITDTTLNVSSFGQDEAGEVYLAHYANSGAIYKIVAHDSVGDGVPDWWRQQYFTNPTTTNATSCAICDPDHDNFNNLQEYTAGTDPTNSASALQIQSLSLSGSALLVGFPSVSTRDYRLEHANDLFPGNWTAVGVKVQGNNGIRTISSPLAGGDTNGFFRVRLVP